VTLLLGDGTRGLPERAPFDAIVVAAAFPSVPPPLIEQLPEGGRLVQPIGPGGTEDVRLFVKRGIALTPLRSVTGAHFVRLCGEHGYPLSEAPADP
jgi:protein-L-isoaspartate(D-aspartate) O-methyltransferase